MSLQELDELRELNELRELSVIHRSPKDYSNPAEYLTDADFFKRYRFRKATVMEVLLPSLLPQLQRSSNRGTPVPPLLCLLTALRYYGSGCLQITTGDLMKLKQNTVSRIVARMSTAIIDSLWEEFIRFPEDLRHNMGRFQAIRGFPFVIGCVDGTHIYIKKPKGKRAENFRNRKGRYSINVQCVCGPDGEFLDVVCRWPGSAHDSRIFNNSAVCLRLEQKELSGIILGDSGYAQTTYLFTPVPNPQDEKDHRYNRAHISTRNVIERSFGVWKKRFRCVGVTMFTDLNHTLDTIMATAILHNLAIRCKEQTPFINVADIQPPDEVVPDGRRGAIIRRIFINQHF